ncbi:MAG: hypothetical protein KBT82_11770 [Marinobacter sp.]|uniref:hypothetical protein n=1 Tax=Marinobacter sp. TaxID=50741 RepID=UPI001B5ED82F|nr:hypothetical protein [Marinobacter sp.]MBQ0746348.1 hypothetical protein [Marinobacter sp.]MBQ0814829.1 hypothetical protein [Marinobacter sp.]|tara:strand:- start:57 stop:275 length:219 start_codon:yes stop_codon:yes gene_type:complete
MSDAETRECERLAFVAGRDGVPAALAFAQQGFRQYTAALREAESGGNQYGAAYADSLNASLIVYKSYISRNE